MVYEECWPAGLGLAVERLLMMTLALCKGFVKTTCFLCIADTLENSGDTSNNQDSQCVLEFLLRYEQVE